MNTYSRFDVDDVEALIRSRLVKKEAYYRLADQEDCVGAMLEAVIKDEPNYDPTKGKYSTFVVKVVSDRFKDYVRQNLFDERNPERHSLNVVSVHSLHREIDDEPWQYVQEASYDPFDDEPEPEEHELLARVDVDKLSPEAQDILLTFAIPLRRGADIEDLAELHNTTKRTIENRLGRLMRECDAF